MVKLKFGKVYFDNGDYIKVNNRTFGLNDDGTLEWIDDWETKNFHPDFANHTFEQLNQYVTESYNALLRSKARRKTAREFKVSVDHWWHIISDEKKIELALRIRDSIDGIVNEMISNYPTSSLNEYYIGLVRRVRYGKAIVPILTDKDIYKLPKYNSVIDKIVGTNSQLLKMAALMYPSDKTRSSKHKAL